MRRSFRFLALLACALPLACSDTSAPTAPVPAPSFSDNGAFVLWGETVFGPWDFVADCGTEPLRFQGTMFNRYHLVTAPSGATHYVQLMIDAQATATGVNSGTVWQLMRVPQMHRLDFANKTALMIVHESDWYTNDAGDRLHAQFVIHFTWNPNGVLTAYKMNVADCHLQPAK